MSPRSISSGAGVITKDKASAWLTSVKAADDQVAKLNEKYILSKSITLSAIVFFVFLQVSAFGVFFFAPVLREFFNIDIGFGSSLGSCAVNGCRSF